MPSFTVTSPEGKKYTGTAPEGATQDDIFSYVQKQIVAQQPMSFADRTLGTKTLTPEQSAAPVDPNYQVGQGYQRGQFESHPITRLIRGAEAPALKAIELVGQIPGIEKVPGATRVIQDVASIKDAREAGRGISHEMGVPSLGLSAEWPAQGRGADTMGNIGALGPGFAIGSGIANMAPGAATMPGMLGVGARAGLGGVIGGVTAGTQPGSTWGDVGMGTALGVAAPLTIDTVQGVGKGLGAIKRYLADKTIPSNMYDKWITDRIGPTHLEDAARRLETSTPNVAGERPMSAQAMVGSDAGPVIQSHGKIIARTPGGVSSDFTTRELKNEGARKIAKTYANQVTVPKALDALNAANQGAGVQSGALITDIQAKSAETGLSTVARKSLQSVQEDIASHTDAAGKIDANELWRIRKELGDVIGNHGKALNNWSKKTAADTESTIQHFIDDAVEQAGGAGWKDFLTEYSGRMKAIGESVLANKMKYKPMIPTDMQGGVNMAEYGSRHVLPNWLSKPITFTKWGTERIASAMEPYVDARAAAANLDPKVMADIIRSRMPSTVPPRYQPMIDALMQQLPAAAGTLAGRSQ
jgi:hypothetical protein